VRRRRIEVVVIFFDIFRVIALGTSDAEEPFLQNRVAAVPAGESKTEALVIVADAGDAVFGPAVGAGASIVKGEGIP
jgi:hypothetical protein